MNFNELTYDRYSVRKFSDREVEQELIDKILETGINAPTAANRQTYKIWVLKSEDAMKKVSETTKYLFGAKVLIAIGSKAEGAWVRPSDGYCFADVDATIAATQMMLAVHELGLGTCWVGYMDTVKLAELFPEMKDYNMVAFFPIGYPAEDAEPAPMHTQRKTRDEIVEEI